MPNRSIPQLPTRLRDWKLIGRTVQLVLSRPLYALLTVVFSLIGISIFVFARNLSVLIEVILSGSLPLGNRLRVLVGMYPFVGKAFTIAQSTMLIITGVLVGIDLALLTYHFREHYISIRDGSGGVGGIVLGTLGGGCAACGSAMLAGILSLAGASGILTLLPLDGLEFGFLAIGTLIISIYWLADGMQDWEINGCPVEIERG